MNADRRAPPPTLDDPGTAAYSPASDGTVAYSPIWDWPTPAVWDHLARHQLPVNPAYEILRRIGAPEHFLRVSHLLDANRLEEGRLTWLRRGWPDLFDELAALLPRLREYV